MRLGCSLEDHACGVGVRRAGRDERELAVEHGDEHRQVAVLRAIEAAVARRVRGQLGSRPCRRPDHDRRQQLQRVVAIARRIAVVGVGQRDDAQLQRRDELHQRREARRSARMPDPYPPVDAAHPHAESPGVLPVVEQPLRAMHLAQALLAQQRAPAPHVEREVAPHVLDRRGHAARRAHRAVIHPRRRHVGAAGLRPRVAGSERRLVALRHRQAARHSQRLEDAALDVPRPRLAARRGDHLAEQRIADVGVLPFSARRIGRVELVGKLLREARLRPPRARQVALQARAVREQFADRDVEQALIASLDRSGGHMVADPVVEPQLAIFLQLQDRERGERLGNGSDAVERARSGRYLRAHVGVAEGLRPDGPVAVHDRERHTGLMQLRDRVLGPGL